LVHPERHNAQRYRRMDRQTDDNMMPTVRLTNKVFNFKCYSEFAIHSFYHVANESLAK